jgi:CheY-like chemotaxis protein
MNGEISIESELGKGTNVCFQLPGVQKVAETKTPLMSDTDPQDIRFLPAKILLAEDNDVNLQVISGLLKRFPMTTRIAYNGQEVLEILKDFRPDLILLDMQMPVMDGAQTLEMISKNPEWKDIPVIALTAYALEEIPAPVRGNLKAYLRKPVVFDALVDQMKAFLPTETHASELVNESTPITNITKEIQFLIENELIPEWIEIKKMMSKDDIEGFAVKIKVFGTAHQIPIFTGWSETIETHARNFDIKNLYSSFLTFRNIVKTVI